MAKFIVSTNEDKTLAERYVKQTLSDLTNNKITKIRPYVFYKSSLYRIDLPSVTDIGTQAFGYCVNLETVNIPSVTTLGQQVFTRCNKLSRIKIPKIRQISRSTFHGCTSLKIVDLAEVATFSDYSFYGTSGLEALILRTTEGVCVTDGTSVFGDSSLYSRGYIYVPSTMIDEYTASASWRYVTSRLRVLEDYTVDGTITGELDETKI